MSNSSDETLKKSVTVSVELWPEVKDLSKFDLKELIIESNDLFENTEFTGSRWICEKQLEIGSKDREYDLDVYIMVEGFPRTQCFLNVTVDGKKTELKAEFDSNGKAYFNEAIKLEG